MVMEPFIRSCHAIVVLLSSGLLAVPLGAIFGLSWMGCHARMACVDASKIGITFMVFLCVFLFVVAMVSNSSERLDNLSNDADQLIDSWFLFLG